MRSPLPAFQAFANDARARPSDPDDRDNRLAGWLAVAKTAERLGVLDATARMAYLAQVATDVLPASDARPTLVHDAQDRPTDTLARLAERFRVEAEQMERAGCFELAFATVSAVCRFVTDGDLTARMLASVHLGRILRQLGELDSATDAYQMAADGALRERDGPLAARAYIGLGIVAGQRGNRPLERSMFERALSHAHPNSATESAASHGLMNVALAERRLLDAMLHGWRAFDTMPLGSDERGSVLVNIAFASLHADFNAAALQGFLHALGLSGVSRVKLSAISGAMRAAARLQQVLKVRELNETGDRAAAVANLPYDAARFLLSAGEAWATIGDRDFARRRLQDARDIAVRHGFFELQVKSEDSLDALEKDRLVAQYDNLTSRSLELDSDRQAMVSAGVARLEMLVG